MGKQLSKYEESTQGITIWSMNDKKLP